MMLINNHDCQNLHQIFRKDIYFGNDLRSNLKTYKGRDAY